VAELARRRDDFRVLLVGSGDLQSTISEKVERLGLANRVAFAGDRGDVNRILMASDVFLFPSLNEGLPLAMLEAQAAGLRCLISDAITEEVIVNRDDFRVLPLAAGATAWAAELDALLSLPYVHRARALAAMQSSPFSVNASVRGLVTLYQRLRAIGPAASDP
jgi:glycosyltransferase involved in cell wall biosynthesis